MIVIGFNIPNIIESISGEDLQEKILIVDNENIFEGNRDEVRMSTVCRAIELVMENI